MLRPHVRLFLAAALLLTFTHQVEAKPGKVLDLADTVATNRILTKLAVVIQSSDLATFLSSKGPFTLFAPTDAAFAKLPPGTLDSLLRPENKERLQHILLFHVVSGKKFSAKDMLAITSLVSCESSPLPLKTMKSGTQMVLKAKIIHADIGCLNGVIHEIDTVLMPPESTLPAVAPPAPPKPPPSTNSAPANPPTETNAAPVATSASPTPEVTNAPPVAPH